MKLKVIAGAIAVIASVSACKKNEPKSKQESVKNSTKDSTVQTPKTLLDSFKQNKDEKAFLTSLYKKLGWGEPKNEKGIPYRLIKIEEIKLYGSDEPCTLAYVDEIDGAMASWPWKGLFVINNKGKVLFDYPTEKYEPVVVFENQSPLLMVSDETSKGNGRHRLMGIKKDTVKEYLNTHGWNIQTIYGGYTPTTLPYTLKDINNDKQKDFIFTGKKKNKPVYLSFVWDAKKESFEPKDSIGMAP